MSSFLDIWNLDQINFSNPFAEFSKAIIEYSPYKRKEEFIKKISFNDLQEVYNEIQDLKINNQISLFNFNTDVDYDQKKIGGRFIFSVLNSLDNNKNKNFKLFFKNWKLTNPINEKIKLSTRIYISLFTLIGLRNQISIEEEKLTSYDKTLFSFITSIEGISITSNPKSTKLSISVDKMFIYEDILLFSEFLKIVLYLEPHVTFKFHYYNDLNTNFII